MAITPEQHALAVHRYQRAQETLLEAADELARKHFRLAVNRAYYAVFYAMRAFLALANKDSSKHSGVISLFNQCFIKQGVVTEISFKAIQLLLDLRHEADYQDFAETSQEEASAAVDSAGKIIEDLKKSFEALINESDLSATAISK